MTETPTQAKIKLHKLQTVAAKLERIGLTIIDKSDLDWATDQIDTLGNLANENRMLRAQLDRAKKNQN